MLDRITDKISEITRQLSGRNRITEKNIEDAVNEIKIALLDADVKDLHFFAEHQALANQ